MTKYIIIFPLQSLFNILDFKMRICLNCQIFCRSGSDLIDRRLGNAHFLKKKQRQTQL